ncbi:hypothetical protein [Novosphingobium sp.]|uniref:hypothetical protein n=1 Tax=Novosphingobium sp. TaxID=1874826 RepID=UPI0025E62169|nr:hypothetical protein [Novosphingobium sp.]MCC6926117.1 hypothetical protein [Novosphingobium sp.]
MSGSFESFAQRLLAAAQGAATARTEQLRLARTDPAQRWRKASLLWPNFTKG